MKEVFVLLEGESVSGPVIAVDRFDDHDVYSRIIWTAPVVVDDPAQGQCRLFLSGDADERCEGSLTSSILAKVGGLPAKGGTLSISRTNRCYEVEYTPPAPLNDIFGDLEEDRC